MVVTVLAIAAGCRDERASPDTTSSGTEVSATATVASTTTAVTTTTGPVTITVQTADGVVVDASRDRSINYRAYLPEGTDGEVPVVLVSHGGSGSERGHRSAPHLGTAYAAAGFVAIHIGHLPSQPITRHRHDRPADVSFVLDSLEAGTLILPPGWAERLDLTRVGHVGHSWGAYTAHAVGGADYGDPSFADDRIDAIVPLSPQGGGQFGGFDNGGGDTSWATVTIPAYNLIGAEEMNDNAVGMQKPDGWRLQPFRSYPDVSDTFVSVIDGQFHSDLWNTGSPEVEAFITSQSTAFLLRYVAGDPSVDACTIGTPPPDGPVVTTERSPAASGSLIADC